MSFTRKAIIGLSVENDKYRPDHTTFKLSVDGKKTKFSLSNWYVRLNIFEPLQKLLEEELKKDY